MMKQLLLSLSVLCLSACGFQPMYAPQSGGPGIVTVAKIPDREGHFLRKALLERLAPGLPGLEDPANLTVVLNQRLSRLAFKPDEAASRTDVLAIADYTLLTRDGSIEGTIRATASYDVPDAPFADISSQTDALERVMSILSRRMVDDMRLKLAAQDDAEAE